MYVNKISFITYITWYLKYGTVKIDLNNKFKTLLDAIKIVVIIYKFQGFTVHIMLADD